MEVPWAIRWRCYYTMFPDVLHSLLVFFSWARLHIVVVLLSARLCIKTIFVVFRCVLARAIAAAKPYQPLQAISDNKHCIAQTLANTIHCGSCLNSECLNARHEFDLQQQQNISIFCDCPLCCVIAVAAAVGRLHTWNNIRVSNGI